MQWLNYIDHWVADGNSLHFLLADQRTGIFEIVSEIPVFFESQYNLPPGCMWSMLICKVKSI